MTTGPSWTRIEAGCRDRILRVGTTPVARYVVDPELDIRLAPRPYLHPVRTLGGTVVTDAFCYDHPWHLGASLTVADVDGTNLWGGRTYVRGVGYVWRDDHGRIRHDDWQPAGTGGPMASGAGFAERLTWCDGDGRTLLRERRTVAATAAAPGWELSFRYALSAAQEHQVVLGSPATNGRAGGAGYGGFFWRATGGTATVLSAGTDDPHGGAEPWLALVVEGRYTLVFRGLSDADRWFVRTGEYNGACAALAFTDPLTIPAGGTIERHLRVLIADGELTRDEIRAALD